MLLTFLLAGRVLDQRMRRRTRDFATNLTAIRADRALKLVEGGEARETPIAAIHPGDLVLVRAGERVAVDGTVEDGRSEVDQSLVTGETLPIAVSAGAPVYAGALNLTGALRVRVTKEATEHAARRGQCAARQGGGAALVLCARRRSGGAASMRRSSIWPRSRPFSAGSWLGAGWQHSLIVAITVLIITCPCALGLAIPAVQVVAARALCFAAG